MKEDLLAYYERELSFLRQSGAEFAAKYPKIAGRLLMHEDECEDPHVERLIEAFAFLAARIQCKLDDELPEITESLLGMLYPHYLAPIPSMSIVQFVLDPEQSKLQAGQQIPRGSMLRSRPIAGAPCKFRTCYPVHIWPIEVAYAGFEPSDRTELRGHSVYTMLRMELKILSGSPLSELREKIGDSEYRIINHLRFSLQGEGRLAYGLYELLFNNALQVEFRTGRMEKKAAPIVQSPDCLHPVGFSRDEGMIPYPDRSFMGYRLLTEYFSFPDKFLFFDLAGMERAAEAGFSDQFEVRIYFDRSFDLETSVNAQTFRLNCTPIINLFRHLAEPIKISGAKTEYRIVPDVRQPLATEVYSVDAVLNTAPHLAEPIAYRPLFSYKHAVDRESEHIYWHANRRPSSRANDSGTEVYLSLVDLDSNPATPDAEILSIETTCTNRDLPGKLPFGGAEGDFHLEGPGVYTAIRCLKKPTPTLRPSLRNGTQWRLISHLSLNYLSLAEREGGRSPEALQEILTLYDFSGSAATRRQIEGIIHVQARRVLRSIGSTLAASAVRGIEISLEFDERQYVGSGVFLFASVLEHFLALYSSINSFSQTVISTRQREGILKRWPPRAGEKILL